MSDQIILDQQTFKALAAGTRVQLLKLLHKRKYMQTELATELGMAVPTIKEHLDALESAGLVLMVDEGRKWKYYELTQKGLALLEPEEDRHRVLVMLSVFLFAFLGGVVAMLLGASPLVQTDSFLTVAEISPVPQSAAMTRADTEVGGNNAGAQEPQKIASEQDLTVQSLIPSPVTVPSVTQKSSELRVDEAQSTSRTAYGWSTWFLAYAALLLFLLINVGFSFVKYKRTQRSRKNLFEENS